MDAHRFDRITRLLGQVASRRRGARAIVGALVAAFVAGAVVPDRAGGQAARPTAAPPCLPVGRPCGGGRPSCRRCCSRYATGTGNDRRCTCRPEGRDCAAPAQCCSGRCENGACGKERTCLVPARRCAPGDRCCAPARCRRRSGGGNRTFCLLADGQPCRFGAECVGGVCENGACGRSQPLVPSGEPCAAGDRCQDPAAMCRSFTPGSGGPAGTFCLLGSGAVCAADRDCVGFDCGPDGRCGADTCVPITAACTVGDRCCPDPAPAAVCGFYAPAGRTACCVPSGTPGQTDVRLCCSGSSFFDVCCVDAGAGACSSDAECCAGRAVCRGGWCVAVVATGDACATGDVCADPNAACTTFAAGSGGPAGTFCLLPAGQACAGGGDCVSNRCAGGVCVTPVPTGQPCGAGDVCRDRDASCTGYAAGSGGPPGTFCLLPDGEACGGNGQCLSNRCAGGRCLTPVPAGDPCGPADVCRDRDATCAAYAAGSGGPPGTFCVFPDGERCSDRDECQSFGCNRNGVCVDVTATGRACGANDVCRPNAACGPYVDESGGPAGQYCLVDQGANCDTNGDCATYFCQAGSCRPAVQCIALEEECDPQADRCCAQGRQEAICETYELFDVSLCCIPTGGACEAPCDCCGFVSDCVDGVCVEECSPLQEGCIPGIFECCTDQSPDAVCSEGGLCCIPGGQPDAGDPANCCSERSNEVGICQRIFFGAAPRRPARPLQATCPGRRFPSDT